MRTTQFKSLFHTHTTTFWDDSRTTETFTTFEGIFQAKLNDFFGNVFIKLKSSHLIVIQGDKKRSTNIENAFIHTLKDGQEEFGVRIIKGSTHFDIHGDIKELFPILKKWCIQIDFVIKYKVKKLMAKGTFANVFQAENQKNNQIYAVKCFDKSQILKNAKDLLSLQKELNILRLLKHKQVLQLVETFETVSYIFLVHEYLKGGDLHDYLMKNGPLSERRVQSVILQLTHALSFIHSQGIIHRDIKPENIILRYQDSLDDIVISDFGLADFYNFEGNYLYRQCGTPGYAAPEILLGLPYDFKIDVYSLGVVFYTLVTGKRPFQGKSPDQIFQSNEKGEINFSNINLKQDGLGLLKKMLEVRSDMRYTLSMVKSHIWLKAPNSTITIKPQLSLQLLSLSESNQSKLSNTPRLLINKKQVLKTEQNQSTERKHIKLFGSRYNVSVGNFAHFQGIYS